jgi:polyphosphate glucokinase
VEENENIRIGIDVGGSSIKAALVDTGSGRVVETYAPQATSRTFEREAVSTQIVTIVQQIDQDTAVGVGFPAAVQDGVIAGPPTAHEYEGWIGYDMASSLSNLSGKTVRVANDADVAGSAELAFGAGRGHAGVVIVLTLGTGVGSALFCGGRLVPNSELGKLYLASSAEVAERSVASRIKTESNLSWDVWSARLQAYLRQVDRLFSPELVILGGAISQDAHHFLSKLSMRCEIRAAELTNDAGSIGAAQLVAGD